MAPVTFHILLLLTYRRKSIFFSCLHYTETEAGAGAGVFSSGQLTAVTAVTAIRQRWSVCQQTHCSLITRDSIYRQQMLQALGS